VPPPDPITIKVGPFILTIFCEATDEFPNTHELTEGIKAEDKIVLVTRDITRW